MSRNAARLEACPTINALEVWVEMACNTMAHRIFCRGWEA